MKDLPSSFSYAILHPSRDMKSLYCAVVGRSKTVPTSGDGKGKSKEKFGNVTTPGRIAITRLEFDLNELV